MTLGPRRSRSVDAGLGAAKPVALAPATLGPAPPRGFHCADIGVPRDDGTTGPGDEGAAGLCPRLAGLFLRRAP